MDSGIKPEQSAPTSHLVAAPRSSAQISSGRGVICPWWRTVDLEGHAPKQNGDLMGLVWCLRVDQVPALEYGLNLCERIEVGQGISIHQQ